MERWATDPDDDRELVDVVDEEVARTHLEWLERLRAEADRADARAKRFAEDAEVDAKRREALFRAWDRQLDEHGAPEPPRTPQGHAYDHARGYDHHHGDGRYDHTHEVEPARLGPSIDHVVGGQVHDGSSDEATCSNEEEEVASAE